MAGQVIRCKSPTSAMQRITDVIRAGMTWFIQGELEHAKVVGFVTKMVYRYPRLERDRFANHRARKSGEAVHKLVVFESATEATAVFWLFASAVDVIERWRDATVDRPRLWTYEAVRQTKPGAEKPVWTWRFEKSAYHQVRETLIERVRKKQDRELEDWITSSKKWAGFAGVRVQHRALGTLLYQEWRRSRGYVEPVPEWPKLRYVRRLKTR